MGNYNSAEERRYPRSYSQLNTFAECAKRYQLSYMQRVPRRPGVWFPAGTAVHESVRRYLLEAEAQKGI